MGTIPWISLADIRELDGKVARDTLEHTNEEGLANSSARLLPEGTVVLSRTASVGFVTILGRPMATSQDFVNWVCGPGLDPHFLAYLLRASRGYIRSLSSGAIHQTVYMPTVESFFVRVPALTRQREIAASLSEQLSVVEPARSAAEARLEAARLWAASRMRVVFSGSEASAWLRKGLGEVGEILSGVTLGRPTNGESTRRVPYLRVANVKDGYLDLSRVYEIEATSTEIERLRLRAGDLLLTEGGDADKLGRGCVWANEIPECIHQNHIFRVRFLLDQVDPAFVSGQVGSAYGRAYFLANAKQTTGIATINRSVLSAFPVMLPDLAKQRRVSSALAAEKEAVLHVQRTAKEALAAAGALPAAVLRQAFGGAL